MYRFNLNKKNEKPISAIFLLSQNMSSARKPYRGISIKFLQYSKIIFNRNKNLVSIMYIRTVSSIF